MTNLKDLKKVKSIDIDEFDGIKSKIEIVDLMDEEQKDFGDGMKSVRQIKISTEKLSNDSDLRASEFVSLKFDNEAKTWGYPDGKNSKAMKVLNYFKVNDFEELKGKECTVVKRVNGEKSFLGIHSGM